MLPRVVVTPGDPRGIGPEVTLEALDILRGEDPGVEISILGPDGSLSTAELAEIAQEARTAVPDPTVPSAAAGEFAGASIERAVRSALSGQIQGIVTAPLHKPSLHASGRDFPGQTEMLAALTNGAEVGMLMAAERTRFEAPLRVLLATTHLPLRGVPAAVTETLLLAQIRLLDSALRNDWGIERPRIGVCALNPHASDGGIFGNEEATIFEPAIRAALAADIDVFGPLPADTVFGRALAGAFDAVVAPYHDVGMAAFKTVSFGTGVNVTIGLPFVRTSPDHGTAFDIAGTGAADSTSMVEAIKLATTLAKRRFDTSSAHV